MGIWSLRVGALWRAMSGLGCIAALGATVWAEAIPPHSATTRHDASLDQRTPDVMRSTRRFRGTRHRP